MTASPPTEDWHFWIDRGGTFTDVVARAPGGDLTAAKYLSEDPARPGDAAVSAIRDMTGCPTGDLPPCHIRMGTTVATNALLERRGTPTLLAITRGFGDALTIGYQDRGDLFARELHRPLPPHAAVAEIDERIAADGTIVTPLDEDAARAAIAAAFDAGLASIAIVLMHGYRYPAHEQRLARIARAIGFSQISVSHGVSALIKLVGRGDTTLADAYLSPVLRRYIDGFCGGLGSDVAPQFMKSSGGLASAGHFHGRDAILSGPAGGIVGMVGSAAMLGEARLIGFDMGGTSTDVSHYAGRLERDSETQIAGTRIRVPMLRIHTVAAGGGSICRWDGTRLLVGPESAGAVPGPAAYGRGGPLTITDCNVLLGKIQPAHFPRLFGPQGNAPLDTAIVAEKFAALAAEVCAATGRPLSPEGLAEGFLAIAVTHMAQAIKRITLARGHDIGDDYALVCFGGAAGQHACLVADALGVERILIHPFAGVLSAYGMGLASPSAIREATLGLALDANCGAALGEAHDALAGEADAALGDVKGMRRIDATLFVRLADSDHAIELDFAAPCPLRTAFDAAFRQQFGYAPHDRLVIDRVRVEVSAIARPLALSLAKTDGNAATEMVRATLAGKSQDVPLFQRAGLTVDAVLPGPAIIIDPLATTVVEPEWQARVAHDASLILTRHAPATTRMSADTATAAADPIRLEIFNSLFMAIAEEMGSALQHSASSVNIRERLDFSCALFDGDGRLVANAPHMPVHLGSMGESVRTILRQRGVGADGSPRDGRGIRPGDAYALNAPYDGGTHLPDITVIMPVFGDDDAAIPVFFVAARGHHADIGGIAPGSMPPDSRTIADEGILFDNVLLVADGQFREADVLDLLAATHHPARNPALNIADLKAQVAACMRGAGALRALAARHGQAVVTAYMERGQAQAEAAVRALIARLEDGHFRYAMDNGAAVEVAVRIDKAARQVTIDFTGTSPILPDNFNAPLPVVRAATLYVLRTMLDDPIPMNEGCLAPVTLIVPDGTMLSPRYPAAVVAGNVETSQVITDALFLAFGAMAGAQGTMNNFTFGNAAHQYYETIAGGSGAGPGFAGTDVIQTHMTNSRLTDPEVLEDRFPVMVEEFSIRRGSGGAGAYQGGDGAVRRVRFLEAMDANILSNRRHVAPAGLAGGGDGAAGRNWIERADGSIEERGPTASASMAPGDIFGIATPGGGGYGKVGEEWLG